MALPLIYLITLIGTSTESGDQMANWKIEGNFMETCNCTMLCPCIVSNLSASPTEGDCKVAIAFHVKSGEKDGVKLDGLNFVVLVHSPGPMAEGKLKVGLIVDDKASEAQTKAIADIATGAAGGPMAGLGPLVGEIAGMEKRPITFSGGGMSYAVKAGELIDQAINGVPSMADASIPVYIDNAPHPASSRLAVAKAAKSMFNAFGIKWSDNSGTRNGHFAPFSWSG
jgi:hypothetical protein